MAAHTVLTNAPLVREISRFQRGFPRDAVDLARSLPLSGMTSLPEAAARRRNLRLLERLWRYTTEQPELVRQYAKLLCFDGAWIEAVRAGDVAIARWIDTLPCRPRRVFPFQVWEATVLRPSVALVEYVTTRFPFVKPALKEHHVVTVIQRDAVDLLQWLETNIENILRPQNPELLAAEAGAAHMLKYLHAQKPTQEWSTEVMDRAARSGSLESVRFLHEVRNDGCTPSAMDDAATRGHLGIVQFLHKHRSEGCTTAAMDGAAGKNYMDVVRFLHDHRSEGCTTKAMDDAAANGHLAMVRFLHANRTEGCTTAAMDNAAGNNSFDIVLFLHTHRSEGCTTKAMDNAAANKHMSMVLFLHKNRTEGCSSAAIDRAATRNHVDVVQFLLDHRTEGYTAEAIFGPMKAGHPSMYKMIHRYRIERLVFEARERELSISTLWGAMMLVEEKEAKPPLAVEAAAKKGDLASVRMLHIHFHQYYCTANACIVAAEHGRANVVAFLVKHCIAKDSLGLVLRGAINSGDLATTQAVAELCKRDELVEAHALATSRHLEEIAEYLASLIPTKMRRCE